MMNPPEAFVQAALAAQPTPPVNNPIVFDQAGQAVMVPPPSVPQPQPQLPAAPVQVQQPLELPVAIEQSDRPSAAPPTPTATRPEQTAANPTSTDAASTAQSVMDLVTSQTTVTTEVQTSSAIATTVTASSPETAASSLSTSASSISTRTHPTSSSIASASTSAASASSAASDEAKPFTQTTGFIFLMVLGGLVLVAVIATLCSTFMRWRDMCGCFPCCRPERDDDEEDGLSDLVRSFDHDRPPTTMASLSRVTSARSSFRPEGSGSGEMAMSTSQNASIERRASLLATSPAQAAFLHSANHVDSDGSVFGGSNAGKYFVGGPGPLRVKNAVEGDIKSEAEVETVVENQHVAGPRHLGVEGNGLTVPWPTTQPSRSFTASSYASSRYGGPPFPSPPVTIEEQQEPNQQQQQSPTRASTWASNLRTTLFTAISANRAAEEQEADAGDRYTRSVLPLHRGSTRRSTRSVVSSAVPVTRRAYPLVIDEKDEQEMDRAEAATGVGSRFMMMNRGGTNQSLTSSVGTALGGIGERYKSWSRSQRSAETEAWVRPVLAGGERARGTTNRP